MSPSRMRTAASAAHPDEAEVHEHGESRGEDGYAAQQNQTTTAGTPSQARFPWQQIDPINFRPLH